MKSEFLNPNSKPSYALMSTISGHVGTSSLEYTVQTSSVGESGKKLPMQCFVCING